MSTCNKGQSYMSFSNSSPSFSLLCCTLVSNFMTIWSTILEFHLCLVCLSSSRTIFWKSSFCYWNLLWGHLFSSFWFFSLVPGLLYLAKSLISALAPLGTYLPIPRYLSHQFKLSNSPLGSLLCSGTAVSKLDGVWHLLTCPLPSRLQHAMDTF